MTPGAGRAPPPEPRRRLRNRLTAFFLLAATPAALVSAGAVVVIDRLIRLEIRQRTAETLEQARASATEALAGAVRTVESLEHSDRVRELAAAVDGPRLERFEGLAANRAAAEALDVLAIVAARGPHAGTILSSAHLSTAIGDLGPAFLERVKQAEAGLVHELIEGNPPELVPALVAVRVVESPPGRPALYLYGGARLDGPRLQNVANLQNATLVLRSPGLRARTFAGDPGAALDGSSARSIELEVLPGGRTLTEEEKFDAQAPSRIDVFVRSPRLEKARTVFTTAAAILVAGSLLAAFVAGSYLARRITSPILELTEAAREVGAGNLEVSLDPRTDDEVGMLVRIFNQMTTELRESRGRLARAERVAAWREIARRVAHEIKNPLFPIQMSMETLRKSYRTKHAKLDEIVEESTRTVLEEVRALNRIVTEFSDFARLPTPQRTRTAPVEILEHVASLYVRPDEPEGNVVFDGEALRCAALPEVEVDRDQVSRALINLVKNALEALPEGGGTVRLEATAAARRDRAGVAFVVADDGAGMSEETRARIFTPYFTTKALGTGLGLAIVERIVTEHDGVVDVESAEGTGTTFTLWFPAAE